MDYSNMQNIRCILQAYEMKKLLIFNLFMPSGIFLCIYARRTVCWVQSMSIAD